MHTRKLLGPIVSAAVALIIVTNFCIVQIVSGQSLTQSQMLPAVWPIALPTTFAVVMVMSTLYHTVQDLVAELQKRYQTANEEAQLDPLTRLANRRILEERIEGAVHRYRRHDEGFAVLMLDLDHFKRANDLLGHQAGDELLKMASERLRRVIRETDTVGRFGGDEFIILQSGVATDAAVRRLCSRISRQMAAPYKLAGREMRLPAGVGAVMGSDQLSEASDYIRAADMALYSAKAAGRNCYRFYTHELDAEARRRDQLEVDLRKALKGGRDCNVVFQPQLSAHGDVIGVESLFRWEHPSFGAIPASEAITIAEESDLIGALSELVFREAARFAKKYPDLFVAVNLSPLQFIRQENLCESLSKLAAEEGVSPAQIELEVTERLFMRLDSGCEQQIDNLKKAGFRISLDDFGTGYSSLSYLRRFKVDRLKLDRSFLTGAAEDNITLIRAAVTFAHSIGLDVVAEGIDSHSQHAIAFQSGCDAVQGYYYGKPMPADEFENFYAQQRDLAA